MPVSFYDYTPTSRIFHNFQSTHRLIDNTLQLHFSHDLVQFQSQISFIDNLFCNDSRGRNVTERGSMLMI